MIESDFLHVDEKLGHSIQKEKAPNQYPKCRENFKVRIPPVYSERKVSGDRWLEKYQ